MLGYSESRVLMVMGGQSSFARWVDGTGRNNKNNNLQGS